MKGRLRRALLRLLAAVACVSLGVAALVLCVPYPVAELDPSASGPIVVEARDGRVLRRAPATATGAPDGELKARPGRARWVTLDQVSSLAVLTLIASEDQRFFTHLGVDPLAVLRAAALNLCALSLRYGGSTLTQQLVRMLHSPGRPRTLWNKAREAVLALQLEQSLGKQAILEQYLNRAYYGRGAYGIEAAAQRYFGKPAASLSAGEATFLSVLPRGPSYYDPIRHRARVLERRAHLLSLLVEQGKLTADAAARAEREPLQVALRPEPFEAPHFVDWVLKEALPEALQRRGGRVRTSLDLDLQHTLERRVAEHAAELSPRGVEQAGVVVLDSQSGEVLAMVGSGGYHAAESGQLNIATWRRHPGSALKPFVYATAIERGDSPASVAFDVFDVPSQLLLGSIPPHERGPVRYREALAGSYNLAAAHVLERVGVEAVMNKLVQAGVGELVGSADSYGLRLSLGATKVRLLDLAAGYGVFVRGGRAVRPGALRSARLHDGRQLSLPTRAEVQVFSPRAAFLTLDMLSDPVARRPMFGQELPADLPYPVAVKTGTARGFADTVAVFATSELTVAAWTGRFDGGATRGVLGMEGAAPLSRAALLAASHGADLHLPAAPPGLSQVEVCPLSGMRPGPTCPNRKRDTFIAGSEPSETCTWHVHDAHGHARVRYPDALAAWARRHQRAPALPALATTR